MNTLQEAHLAMDLYHLTAGIVFGILASAVCFLIWKAGYTARIRMDAIQRSQAVTSGKVHEQLIPYLPSFPYNPRDVRFLGSPVDLVVFDGLSEGRLERIVFVEVKTGGSGLTVRERWVRDVVRSGEIEWEELRVPRSLASGAA